MPANSELYIDYFRQLAVSHKDIQHNPDAEYGDTENMDKRFTVWGVDEIINGNFSRMGSPSLNIEMYINKLSQESAFDVRQNPTGSMSVLTKAVDETFQAMQTAYATSEKIIYDILQKIWADHYQTDEICDRPFKQFYFKGEVLPTGRMGERHFGYYYAFEFVFHKNVKIESAPQAGTFL